MATIKEDCEDDIESCTESEFDSLLSDSDTTIEFAIDKPLPPIGNKQCSSRRDGQKVDDLYPNVTSPRVGRFPRGRRASCPAIMGWDRDHLKYLVAGSKTLPDHVVSRAYQSLLSHTEPILTQNKPKEKRLLSYYDYVPSRKVYNEQDQCVKDQNRDMLKLDLMIEEHRKHHEAIAMEKELMGEDYDYDLEKCEDKEEELEDIMLERRLRRLHVTDSAYQGFFPQMDLYDFSQAEKERQKQALTSSVRGKGRVQRRGSESHLKRRDSKPGAASTTQSGQRTERQLSRRESISNDLKSSGQHQHSTKKLERTNTQTKINALPSSQTSHHHHRFISSAQPQATQNKPGAQEMKFQVVSAMRSRFPDVHRTNSGITDGPMAQATLRQEPTTAPASTKFRRKRAMSLGNTSTLMPLKLGDPVP